MKSNDMRQKFADHECEIKIIGRNLQVTKGMREHIEDKIHRLEKFGTKPIEISIFLEKIRAEHKVEVIYKFSHFEVFAEGWSADEEGLAYEGTFRCISLQVHSSLEAVGLTAAVTSELAAHDISVNVIAGYHHDHIFVPSRHADLALSLLKAMSSRQ